MLVVAAAQPERKRWWRNLHEGAPVDVRLRGVDRRGSGIVVVEPEEVERGRALYLERFPRAEKSLADAVVVVVELTGERGDVR